MTSPIRLGDKRNFLRGGAAAAMAAGLGAAFGGRGIAYADDAASQLRFSAQLSRNPGAAKVFLDHGPTPAMGATVEAEVRNLVTQLPRTDGGVLSAEQFYAHSAVDGLPGRVTHFYRWRTADGYSSDVLSASTAMPSSRAALLPFRFTMMGDQGIDDTPALPAGMPSGA